MEELETKYTKDFQELRKKDLKHFETKNLKRYFDRWILQKKRFWWVTTSALDQLKTVRGGGEGVHKKDLSNLKKNLKIYFEREIHFARKENNFEVISD